MTLAQVDATALAPYLAGPGAAVVVLMLVLGGLYKLTTTYLLPLANRALDSHLHRIDKLISANQEESKAITRTLASIDRRLARLEGLTDGAPLAPLAPMGDK
jgi:hypothetical protein